MTTTDGPVEGGGVEDDVPLSGYVRGSGTPIPPGEPAAQPGAPATAAPAASKRALLFSLGGTVAILVVGFLVFKSSGSKTKTISDATTATSAAGAGQRSGFGGGAGRGANGTLTAVEGTTLAVTGRDGATTKVLTNASTAVSKAVPGMLTDVKQGDRVAAMGTGTTDAITAASLTDTGVPPARPADGQGPAGGGTAGAGAPGQRPGRAGGTGPGGAPGAPDAGFVLGTVTSINGATITVSTVGGAAATITTTTATAILVLRPSTVSALTLGQPVRATGARAADGTVTATAVQQGGIGFGRGPRGGAAPTTVPPAQ